MLKSVLRNPLVSPLGGLTRLGRGGGGGPADEYMGLGVNLGWVTTWAGAWPFNDLCLSMGRWGRTSGSGAYTQDQGLLTAAVSTDRFRAYLSDGGNGLPSGTYTVLNPDGLKLAIAGFAEPSTGWTTATQFTFNYTPGTFLGLFVEGSVTRNLGKLAIILPGRLAAYQAGDIWNDDFIAFHQAISPPVVRTMDWTVASNNIETNWSDRATTDKISLRTPASESECVVPYEYICDLAGRINADVWVCIPPRATTSYVQSMANLFAANLPAGRRVWLELGNEIWNYGAPWADGTGWIDRYNHTRRTAVADYANQKYTLAAHGLTNAAAVSGYASLENRSARASPDWQTVLGATSYMKVLDADNFELYREPELTNKIPIVTSQVNYLFVVNSEAGKTSDMNGNYGAVSLRNWNIFDAAVGRSRVVHLICSMAVVPSHTAGRLAAAGVQPQTDYVAIAPYFGGSWFGGRTVAGDCSVTLGWYSTLNLTGNVGVYASGSTPSDLDVMNGTGAIATQSLAYTTGPSTYTDSAAITGLVNGTTYTVHALLNIGSRQERVSFNVTPSAVGGTSYFSGSGDALAQRERNGSINGTHIQNHAAVSGGVPVICYEGGAHYHQSAPSEVNSWLDAYMESADHAKSIRVDLQSLANAGSKFHCFYGDVLGTRFHLADSYTDTTDVKYGVYKDFGGRIKKRTPLALPDLLLPDFSTEPGAYPAVVHSFENPSLNYRIVKGDLRGNFAVSGGQLMIANSNQLDWAKPTTMNLVLEADDGVTFDTFNLSFTTGSAWYEADALFAWSTLTDTDTAAVNPDIGSTLPLNSGSAATYSGADKAWQFTAGEYTGSGLISAHAPTKPTLIAYVFDRSTQGQTWSYLTHIGGANFISLGADGGLSTSVGFTGNIGSRGFAQATKFSLPTVGKNVLWMYIDPDARVITCGKNQADVYVDTTRPAAFFAALPPNLTFGTGGPTDTTYNTTKLGGLEVVNRTGLTLAQAKAIVAKIQAHHSIP